MNNLPLSSDITRITLGVLFIGVLTAARGARGFARRLAGHRGEDAAMLAAKTIRGVALGIVLTALIQSALGGISGIYFFASFWFVDTAKNLGVS